MSNQIKSLITSLVILTGACSMTLGENAAPATDSSSATTQASVGSVDLRDYCTVLLAPKLQDHLQVTDDQRKKFAEMKTTLYAYLHNAAGNMHGPHITPGIIGARAEVVLGKVGTMVQDELTPAQQTTLAGMFDDKTLRPIKVSSSVGRSVRPDVVEMGVYLDYTHYGEKDQKSSNASATQTSAPAEATPASTKPNSDTATGDHASGSNSNIARGC